MGLRSALVGAATCVLVLAGGALLGLHDERLDRSSSLRGVMVSVRQLSQDDGTARAGVRICGLDRCKTVEAIGEGNHGLDHRTEVQLPCGRRTPIDFTLVTAEVLTSDDAVLSQGALHLPLRPSREGLCGWALAEFDVRNAELVRLEPGR